jgi:RNA polymerase sigma factor (TIGR02999 family)
MSNVTHILSQIESGDPSAAEQLLPLVYQELRKLAAVKMAQEKPDHTLQATALVHEAYLRLVDVDEAQHWDSRGHFFAAAAEAMRRILVDRARRQGALKRGAALARQELTAALVSSQDQSAQVIAIDEALEGLAKADSQAAELVKLRYFAGFSNHEAAQILKIPPRTADRIWAFARSWLLHSLSVS